MVSTKSRTCFGLLPFAALTMVQGIPMTDVLEAMSFPTTWDGKLQDEHFLYGATSVVLEPFQQLGWYSIINGVAPSDGYYMNVAAGTRLPKYHYMCPGTVGLAGFLTAPLLGGPVFLNNGNLTAESSGFEKIANAFTKMLGWEVDMGGDVYLTARADWWSGFFKAFADTWPNSYTLPSSWVTPSISEQKSIVEGMCDGLAELEPMMSAFHFAILKQYVKNYEWVHITKASAMMGVSLPYKLKCTDAWTDVVSFGLAQPTPDVLKSKGAMMSVRYGAVYNAHPPPSELSGDASTGLWPVYWYDRLRPSTGEYVDWSDRDNWSGTGVYAPKPIFAPAGHKNVVASPPPPPPPPLVEASPDDSLSIAAIAVAAVAFVISLLTGVAALQKRSSVKA